MKQCLDCKVQYEVAEDNFHKDKQKPDGFNSYCKTCVAVDRKARYDAHRQEYITKAREWREQHRERYEINSKEYRINNKVSIKDQKLRSNYGINLEQWQSILSSQDDKCAICKSSEPRVKGWQTDHCHETGKVRGILCVSCNNGLGRFKDNPLFLREAASYLENI